MGVRIVSRAGEEITSLEDWLRMAPPARKEAHWKDGRSAKELARAWIEGDAAEQVVALLGPAPGLDGLAIEEARAEAQARFDSASGPRNHDLLLVGTAGRATVVIGVEAKADEVFDRTLRQYAKRANDERERNPRSAMVDRLEGLSKCVFGHGYREQAHGDLRYQLFSATAGTLASARDEGASRAILLIHEFTGATDRRKVDQNAADLRAFAERALRKPLPEEESWVVGPARLPGAKGIDLFLAKLVSSSRPRRAG